MAARKKGKQTRYTDKLGEEICNRLSDGESLASICRDIGFSTGTVYGWVVRDHNGFAAKYERAREAQAHFHADEIARLAAKAEGLVHDEDAQPNAIKVAVDARKWCAERMSGRRRYAPRQEVSGPDGGPVETESKVSIYLPSNGREKNSRKGVDSGGAAE